MIRLFAAVAAVGSDDRRHDGSELAPFADEAELELTGYLRGWSLSLRYRERMDARFIGVGFGTGVGE